MFDLCQLGLYPRHVQRPDSSASVRYAAVLLSFLVLALTGCIEYRPPKASKHERPVTAELLSLSEQVDHLAADNSHTLFERRGALANNRREVYSLMARALVQDASDLRLAASILLRGSDGTVPEARSIALILATEALGQASPEERPGIQALVDSIRSGPH